MAEADRKETQAKLADLKARAAAKDAAKDFETAADLYSQATELQAELNGELSNDNADLLFAYGKSLYNVAVSKSDVLGSKVAGESSGPAHAAGRNGVASAGSSAMRGDLIKHAVDAAGRDETSEKKGGESSAEQNQSFFQFTGDENFDDSEGEDYDDDAEKASSAGSEEQEEDDFANAFEVLDIARVLYSRKVDAARQVQGNGKAASVPPEIRHMEERLADTYDLQAEISLEAERFADAVTDLKTALGMKQSLYPLEDPSLAECHYKLSLALEFASVNKPSAHGDGETTNSTTTSNVDESMRREAVDHMEKAIESCKIRVAQEQKKLDTGEAADEDKKTAAKKSIANVKEILADMEQRVSVSPSASCALFCFAYVSASSSLTSVVLRCHWNRVERSRRL